MSCMAAKLFAATLAGSIPRFGALDCGLDVQNCGSTDVALNLVQMHASMASSSADRAATMSGASTIRLL